MSMNSLSMDVDSGEGQPLMAASRPKTNARIQVNELYRSDYETVRSPALREEVKCSLQTAETVSGVALGEERREDFLDCSKKKRVRKVLPPEEESPQQQNVGPSVHLVNKRKSCQMDEGTSCGTSYHKEKGFDRVKETKEMVMNFRLRQMDISTPRSINFEPEMFSDFDWPSVNGYFTNPVKGGFGSVAKFTDVKSQKELVMKWFKDNDKLSYNEIGIPLSLRSSPFIGRVLGLGYNNGNCYLALENNGKSLYEFIRHLGTDFQELQNFKQKHVKLILRDMLQAFSDLARHGFVHHDVKPENICVKWCPKEDRYVAKLIDFGSSRTLQDSPEVPRGMTCEYLPPSFVTKFFRYAKNHTDMPRLTHKDDVYGLAMTIVFIQLGSHPMIFHFTDERGIPQNYVTQLRIPLLRKIGEMTSLPNYFFSFPECREIEPVLKKMLDLNDSERPNAGEVLGMLEGSTRFLTSRAKKMKVEEDPGNNIGFNLKRRPHRPKMIPKSELTMEEDQTQEYGDMDRRGALKVNHGATAVCDKPNHQAKCQQKVERMDDMLNVPDVPGVDLSHSFKPGRNQWTQYTKEGRVVFSRQPSCQFDQIQAPGQQEPQQLKFNQRLEEVMFKKADVSPRQVRPGFNLHCRPQVPPKPILEIQAQPLYHSHNQSNPQGLPETKSLQGAACNIPALDQLLSSESLDTLCLPSEG